MTWEFFDSAMVAGNEAAGQCSCGDSFVVTAHPEDYIWRVEVFCWSCGDRKNFRTMEIMTPDVVSEIASRLSAEMNEDRRVMGAGR